MKILDITILPGPYIPDEGQKATPRQEVTTEIAPLYYNYVVPGTMWLAKQAEEHAKKRRLEEKMRKLRQYIPDSMGYIHGESLFAGGGCTLFAIGGYTDDNPLYINNMPTSNRRSEAKIFDFLDLDIWNPLTYNRKRRPANSFEGGGGINGDDDPQTGEQSHPVQPIWNNYLIHTQGRPYKYRTDGEGRVKLPWFDEIFPDKKLEDTYENQSIIKDGYKGSATYGDIFQGLTRALQVYNEERDKQLSEWRRKNKPVSAEAQLNSERENRGLGESGRLTFFEPQQWYVTMPSPSGSEGTRYNDKRARYRMMTAYDNLKKYGHQHDINNWHESSEYRTQDARYIDLRNNEGLPFRHYTDGNLLDGSPIKLYAEHINVPVKNAYGEIWYPMSEHLKAKTARIGSHHHPPVGLYSEEPYELERYIAFDPTTDRRLAEQNGQDPENVDDVATLIHEWGHSKYPNTPPEGIPKENWTLTNPRYFTNHNGTEISVRTSQVLNYHNLTMDDVNKMTANDFKKAYMNYLIGIRRLSNGRHTWTSSGENNNMDNLYDQIDSEGDWEKIWNWLKGNGNNWNMYKKGGFLI